MRSELGNLGLGGCAGGAGAGMGIEDDKETARSKDRWTVLVRENGT